MKNVLVKILVITFVALNLNLVNNANAQNAENSNFEKALNYIENKEYKKASQIFKSECDKNNYPACTNLGVMYVNGYGVKRDLSKAIKLYKKSCDNSNKIACSNLAGLYLNSSNTFAIKRDLSKAKEIYLKGCEELNDGVACRFYGEIMQNSIFKNDGTFISLKALQADENKASEYYKKACDLKEFSGCYLQGLLEIKNNEMQNAMNFLNKACEAKLEIACSELQKIKEKSEKISEVNQKTNSK